jgi:hypothetical protein
LESVSSAKYLGITLQSDLKWTQHTNNIVAIANKSLGFLKRNLKTSNTNIKSQAYLSLVRPKLDYACSVWDPHTAEHYNKSLSWLDFKYSGKSFIYTRKRTGSRTVPCGTPEVTGAISDDSPSRTTVDPWTFSFLPLFVSPLPTPNILDPVKLNYCPLFKNLPQIQIKIFKLISLSWTLSKPLTKFHINDFNLFGI